MPRRIKESAFFSEKNFSRKDLLKQRGLHKKDDMRKAKRLYRILCSIFISGLNTDYNERHYRALHASRTKEQLCVVKLRKSFVMSFWKKLDDFNIDCYIQSDKSFGGCTGFDGCGKAFTASRCQEAFNLAEKNNCNLQQKRRRRFF